MNKDCRKQKKNKRNQEEKVATVSSPPTSKSVIDKNTLILEPSLAMYNRHWCPLKLLLGNIVHTTEGTSRVGMAKRVDLEKSLFICSILILLSLLYPTVPTLIMLRKSTYSLLD